MVWLWTNHQFQVVFKSINITAATIKSNDLIDFHRDHGRLHLN